MSVTNIPKSKAAAAAAAAASAEEERRKEIVKRDFIFLVIGLIAASVMSYLELHAADVDLRGGDASDQQQKDSIVDTGYILTKPIHAFLKENRGWNDFFAFVNTIIGVLGPGIYMVYKTFWVGDYEPVFRYGAISVLRSLCGWCTYLAPSPEYLASNYDFPDISQCLIKECGDPALSNEVNPFVSFFSGHVATLVVVANHAYLHGHRELGLFFHGFNVLQIIRLLATRGHYSIDIIIGFYMAKSVSAPAGSLGRIYSRGAKNMDDLLANATGKDVFETIIGVSDERQIVRMSKLMNKSEFKEALKSLVDEMDDEKEENFPEPTAKLAAEGKLPPVKLD